MNMFTKLAQKATTLSAIMEGREKISVAQLISQFPEGVTVIGIDMITTSHRGEESTYPVFIFAEDDTKFGFGGVVFKSIAESWIAAFEGDIAATNAALKAQGGCKCKFTHTMTKDGRNLTSVQAIG